MLSHTCTNFLSYCLSFGSIKFLELQAYKHEQINQNLLTKLIGFLRCKYTINILNNDMHRRTNISNI